MAKPEKTKDRKRCGIVENKIGDTTKSFDVETGKEKTYNFLSEEILYDDDGFIIGVNKLWQ